MSDIVISPAFGYASEDVAVFLRSARAHMPDVPVLLLRAGRDRTFEAKVTAMHPNARVWVPPMAAVHEAGRALLTRGPLESVWSFTLQRLADRLGPFAPATLRTLPFCLSYVFARHFYHVQLLQEIADTTEAVLLADVRDVVFEGDIFKHLGEGLLMGAEPQRMRDSAWNMRSMLRIRTDEDVMHLLDKQVLCAGVILGSLAHVQAYVKAMIQEIAANLRHVAMRKGDQGIHNLVVWTERVGLPIEVSVNGKGPIWTIGLLDDTDLGRLGLNGKHESPDHHAPAIIHQYDRHPQLNQLYAEKYGE